MTIRSQIVIAGFLIHFLMSCAAQKKNEMAYYENLSDIRPRVSAPVDTTPTVPFTPVQPTSVLFTRTVNAKVDAVLDSIDRFNLIRRSVDGFTIQIYSGQNREDAMTTKMKMSADMPDLIANLQYQQPKFRVTVGKYYSKLEAYQDLSRLRNIFSSAILVPEKIAIR